MNILCLDPGFNFTGWAVVSAHKRVIGLGCIRTEASKKKLNIRKADDDAERSKYIMRELLRVYGQYDAKAIVAELPSAGAKGARAIACMARAAAIVAVLAEITRLPAEWVTPGQVKQITGKKTASKDEVEAAVMERWPSLLLPDLACEREHVADALGAYIAAENSDLVRLIQAGLCSASKN